MAVEIWGGHECTLNRVGDVYRDQTKLTGHEDRLDDLNRFAALGLKRLRYPLLWERTETSDGTLDWRWPDAQMARLRDLGIDPIVGLLHHGSGPSHTNLLDPDFPAKFARYAGAVAARYPYVMDWTPINEPLTTARFSALYGHWYPHARDEASFWRALLNQIDATRMAMQEIRRIIPGARLVQTDDLGRTYATAGAQHVADHYNDRRWMGWDLLCGRVTPGHSFWERLCDLGLEPRLTATAAAPCVPDVVGINHYITSDRYLDDNPANGIVDAVGYRDGVAAREMPQTVDGLDVAITDCWARYGLPIAVTECHLSCTREEQLRWLFHATATCNRLANDGIDVRAITVWALLGALDWDSLVTKSSGRYEPGAFDISGPKPRLTALGKLVLELVQGATPANEAICSDTGWWHRIVRRHDHSIAAEREVAGRPMLITGATGTLGRALAGACRLRGLRCILTSRDQLDLDDDASIAGALDAHAPSIIINAAGWVRVDDAETEEASCFRANAIGPLRLAAAAEQRGIRTVQFSSDLVFGGERDTPWSESDAPQPLNAYGRSKAAMEAGFRARFPGTLIIRTAAFFSPFDEHNFARSVERTLAAGQPFRAAAAQVVRPTYVPDLANAVLDLVIDGEAGIWHLSNGQSVSWDAFARMIAREVDLPERLVESDFSETHPAKRPPFSALGSTKGPPMPSLASAISRYAEVRRAHMMASANRA